MSGRDRLAFGVLLPSGELNGATRGPNFNAAALAIGELNAALTGDLPELVAVACDEADAAAQQALKDAEVRILIGPISSLRIANARSFADGESVFFAPYADAPQLDQLPSLPTSSLVSCTPNRRLSSPSLLRAVTFLQTQLQDAAKIPSDGEVVLALSDNERELGFDVFGVEELSSASVVQLDYDNSPIGQGLVTELRGKALVPSLLIAASATDDWSRNIDAIDDSVTEDAKRPYYLLSDKRSDVASLIETGTGSNHPQYRRVFTLTDSIPSTSKQVHEQFAGAYLAKTGYETAEGLDATRDCVYLAAYAALAAQFRFSLSTNDLTAQAISIGLRALTGDRKRTTSAADISKILLALQTGRGSDASVSLIGGSGALDLEGIAPVTDIARDPRRQYVRPSARNRELYCGDPINGFAPARVSFSTEGSLGMLDDGGTFASCLKGPRP